MKISQRKWKQISSADANKRRFCQFDCCIKQVFSERINFIYSLYNNTIKTQNSLWKIILDKFETLDEMID